jgi:micrococcal nuclease
MKIHIWIVFFILPFFILAKDCINYGETKISKIISISAGNTFNADIDEYPPIIGKNITIRISNIYTPQTTSKDPELKLKAQEAKIFTKNFLEKGKIIILKNIKRDKYFRLTADVIVDDKNLASELINNKLAQPFNAYTSNKSSNWTIIN